MKTILPVALLIVGFSYVTYAYPPTLGTVNQCCGPQPEDLRTYRVILSGDPFAIIPEVEGNGFVITGLRASTTSPIQVFQDTGEGPEEVFRFTTNETLGVMAGIPLAAGSTITITGNSGSYAVIIGYVY